MDWERLDVDPPASATVTGTPPGKNIVSHDEIKEFGGHKRKEDKIAPSSTTPKTITKQEIEQWFDAMRRGAEATVDKKLAVELGGLLFKEYKMDKKVNVKPIIDVLKDYNTCLHALYRDAVLMLLSLPDGMEMQVQPLSTGTFMAPKPKPRTRRRTRRPSK